MTIVVLMQNDYPVAVSTEQAAANMTQTFADSLRREGYVFDGNRGRRAGYPSVYLHTHTFNLQERAL